MEVLVELILYKIIIAFTSHCMNLLQPVDFPRWTSDFRASGIYLHLFIEEIKEELSELIRLKSSETRWNRVFLKCVGVQRIRRSIFSAERCTR